MDTLKAGSTGDSVKELQEYLSVLNYYAGNPDGKFDDATISALKALQSSFGLQNSGELDKATALELDGHLSLLRGALSCLGFLTIGAIKSGSEALRLTLTDFQADQNLSQSGRLDPLTRTKLSEEITKLQSKLYFLGDYTGFVDGAYNPFIVPAIFAFQKR